MPVAIDGTGSIAGLTTALSVAQGGTGAVTAGAALTTLGAQLNATVALTAAYTVVAADRGKLFDCSGTFTITLTAAATLGAGFSFAVRNSGTGVITLDPAAAELVDGVATITYAAGVSSLVTCNGTAFKNVGLSVAVFTKKFTSSAQVITSAGALTIAHGLGEKPKVVRAFIKCIVADAGFVVGDELEMLTSGFNLPGIAGGLRQAVVTDATNFRIRYGAYASVYSMFNYITGNGVDLINASWTFSIEGFA